jgi:hypothetical protein
MDIRTALKLTKGDVFAAALLAEAGRTRDDTRADELLQLSKDGKLPETAKAFLKKKPGYKQAGDEQNLKWFKEFAATEEDWVPSKRARPGEDANEMAVLKLVLTEYVEDNEGDYFFVLEEGVYLVNYNTEWVEVKDKGDRTLQLIVQKDDTVVLFRDGSSAASGSAADEDTRDPSPVAFDDTVPLKDNVYEREAAGLSADDEEPEGEDLLVDEEWSEDEGSTDVSSLVDDEDAEDNPMLLADPTVDDIKKVIFVINSELDDLANSAFYAYQNSWNEASLEGAPDPLVKYVKGVNFTSFAEYWDVDERVLSEALKVFWSQDDAVGTFFAFGEDDDLKLWQIRQDHDAIMDPKNEVPDPLVKNLVGQLDRELKKLQNIHTNEAYPSKKWFQNWELFTNFRKQTGKEKGSKELDDRTRVRVAQAFLYKKIEGFDQYGVALNDISVDYFLQQFKGEKEIQEELGRLQANWSAQEEPAFFEYFAGLYQKLGINSFDKKYLLLSSDPVKKQEKNFELFFYIYEAIDQKLSIPRERDEEEEARLEKLKRKLQKVKEALESDFTGQRVSRRARKLEGVRTSIERKIDMLQKVTPADRMARLRAFRAPEKFERELEKVTWQTFFHRRSQLMQESDDPGDIVNIEEQILEEFEDVFPDPGFARYFEPEDRDLYKRTPWEWGDDELKSLYDEWKYALTPPKVPPELQSLLLSLPKAIGGRFWDKSVYYETPEDYSNFYSEKMSFAYWENTLKVALEKWIGEKKKERRQVYSEFERGELQYRPNFDNIGPQKIRSYKSTAFQSLLASPAPGTPNGQGLQARYNDVLYLVTSSIAVEVRKRQIRKWAERFCFGYRFISNSKGFIDHGEKVGGREWEYKEMGWWNRYKREMARYLPFKWSSDGEQLISEAWVKIIIEAMVEKLDSRFK